MMNTIEELTRQQLKNDVHQPPEGVWNDIADRLSSPQSDTSSGKSSTNSGRSAWTYVAIASAVMVLGLAIYFASTSKVSSRTDLQQISQDNGPKVEAVTPNDVALPSDNDVTTNLPTPPQAVSTAIDNNRKAIPVDNRTASNTVAVYNSPKTIHDNTAATGDSPSHNPLPEYLDNDNVPDFFETAYPLPDTSARTKEHNEKAEVYRDPDSAMRQAARTMVIPNLVTPNGDSYNDCWTIPNLTGYGTVRLQVFDAEGHRVFSSDNYQNDFCGSGLPDGNYFYVLVFRNLNVSRRGALVIRR